jgi:hypothetical protein
MPDPRTAVMILVEASWADQTGVLQAIPACVEDKSAGGACIRTKTPIGVGSRLKIQGRWEQISGTARYCRSVGKDYLVGIQRDTTNSSILARPRSDFPQREDHGGSDPPASIKIQTQPVPLESKHAETIAAEPKLESAPSLAIATPPATAGQQTDSRSGPRSSPQNAEAPRSTEFPSVRLTKAQESGKERKPMQRKWSDLIHRHNQQDGVMPSGNGDSNSKTTEQTPANRLKEEVAGFQVELLPVEDIYRTAGIMNLRRGYSIGKVVEMLHGEHGRGLSKEAKRAAILMALDAAGIPIDEVLQDAKARQDALNSYEAEVRKEVESEWARKAEENVKIQAELERVKAHFTARISRNQDGVAREKAVFGSWLTMKQQEFQSIAEAAELCLKSSVSEPAGSSLPAVSMAAAAAKLV